MVNTNLQNINFVQNINLWGVGIFSGEGVQRSDDFGKVQELLGWPERKTEA